MKTNHRRAFKARTEGTNATVYKRGFKREGARGLRRFNGMVMASLRTGAVDCDTALFGLTDLVSDPWNWD